MRGSRHLELPFILTLRLLAVPDIDVKKLTLIGLGLRLVGKE